MSEVRRSGSLKRRFIVRDRSFLRGHRGLSVIEGYLVIQDTAIVHVRLTDFPAAHIAFSGRRLGGARVQVEHEIPFALGENLVSVSEPAVVTKMRYPIQQGLHIWQVDVFLDANDGVVIAEVDVTNGDRSIEAPDWCGREVTNDERFYDEYLATHPFCNWQ